MRYGLSGKQAIIAKAIKEEMSSGMSFKEAVRSIVASKRFNHMTVKKVAEKFQANPSITDYL